MLDLVTMVSVMSGNVKVRFVDCKVASVVEVPVVADPLECLKILVLSVALYTVN